MPASERSSSATAALQQRRALLGFGLAYLLFVVYGSLVPLHYHGLPWETALQRFRAIPFLELGIGSRADWVANILLFIPLSFAWIGALGHGRSLALRVTLSLLVLIATLALSVGIEFTQLFFPQRTVSQNDIAAESFGACIGIAVWWSAGARLLAGYQEWRQMREPADFASRLAGVYLAVVFAYGVLPLDLTLSVVEFFHKWREGKLNLIPFAGLPADPAQAAYGIVTDALIWFVPALLWRLHGRRSSMRAWAMSVGAATLLEVLQLFVYSRVTDVTDILTAALGAAAGAGLGARLAGQTRQTQPQRSLAPALWLPLTLALAWLAVLAIVFWYPFDFRTDGATIRQRLGLFWRVPFTAYYYGTEFRAVTEVFHKVLFFAPLGTLLAWLVSGLPWLWRARAGAASIILISLIAFGIELVQATLPSKFPDSTDWFMESLGGILGYFVYRTIRRRVSFAGQQKTGGKPRHSPGRRPRSGHPDA